MQQGENRIGASVKVDPIWKCKAACATITGNFPENHQKAAEAIYSPAQHYPDRRPIPNVWRSHQEL